MTWYYNNEGVADGPHDEAAMADLWAQKRITGRTLVWHPEAESWQEAAAVASAWERPAPSGHAEIRQAQPSPEGGFLKRLFGLGRR